MKKIVALIGMGVILQAGGVFADAETSSQKACPSGRIPEEIATPGLPDYPFFGMGLYADMPSHVTLYLNAELQGIPGAGDAVRQGTDKWPSACQQSSIPLTFEVDPSGSRPEVINRDSPAYRTTVLVELARTTVAERTDGGLVLSKWISDRNRIEIFGMCPDRVPRGDRVCLRPNVPINWAGNLELLAAIVAHELGHAMGLAHDIVDYGCAKSTLMSEVVSSPGALIWSQHCKMVRLLNDPAADCNKDPRGANEPHACDRVLREEPSPRPPGGPGNSGGHGNAFTFCESYPMACDVQLPGLLCDFVCVKWSDGYGGNGGSCGWECFSPLLRQNGDAPFRSSGPAVGLLEPRANATLSGLARLEGFAMEFFEPTEVQFFVDGQRVAPLTLQQGLDQPAACRWPLGIERPECRRNSGFRAQIDTRNLANGPHVLAVVGTNASGFPTSIEVPITVANGGCAGAAAPAVGFVAPAAQAAVGGTVEIEASASDDVGVARVDVSVDGVVRAQLLTAPYRFAWDSASVANGGHRLTAQAIDGCGNRSPLVERQITVDNRQTPYRGAPVALPGRIQAEEYDEGLPGVGYYDTTPGNAGGQLRNGDVDLGVAGGQYAVGWVAAGEWLEYAVSSPVAATYLVRVRQASPSGASVKLSVDGGAPRSFQLPATGAYTTWSDTMLAGSIEMPAGIHVLRLEAASAGFNLDWLELASNQPSCVASVHQGCLHGRRFAIAAQIQGQPAKVQATLGDVVYFQVFDPQNVEVALKVLDARPIDGHFWTFHGSLTSLPYEVSVIDTTTGEHRRYVKSASDLCGGADTLSFDGRQAEVPMAACTESATGSCLLGGRFRVEVLHQGVPRTPTRVTDQTASFAFFSPGNAEVVVKLLDGGAINGHFWVFFGSLTNQAYEVRVTDTATGVQRVYPNGAAYCGRADFDDF